MATIHLCFSPSLPTTLSPSSLHPKTQAAALTFTSLSHSSNPKLNGNRKRVQIVAAGGDLLGDFGGRDPFPAEIESRFGEKVLGNVNTEHKILIPNISALSLAQQECEEVFPSQPPISPQDAQQLIRKLSMCETPRDVAWERRRRQILLSQERRRNGIEEADTSGPAILPDQSTLTDEDLHELKGCIDLGFGFNEENGHGLTNTLPALDLYFAVNRQFSPSPVSTPNGSSSSRRSSSVASPKSDSDNWKICSPGDDPQHVKMKLRHWAQAVACSVKQSY